MQQFHARPSVGNWYDSMNMPECFMVIGCDKNDFIQIQYQDGEIDRIDYDTWYILDPEAIPEPEDAGAPFGDIDPEDEEDDLDYYLRHIDDGDTNLQ